jgi:hypothetical protein
MKEAAELRWISDSEILDCIVDRARWQEVFSREITPTEQRVLAAFLYHAGLPYRKIEPFVERSQADAGNRFLERWVAESDGHNTPSPE